MKKAFFFFAIFFATLTAGLTAGLTVTVHAAPYTWKVGDATALTNALTNFASGDTIQLTANITYNNGIIISVKGVTFDVQNFTLNVNNPSGNGLTVQNSGAVNFSATTGELYATRRTASCKWSEKQSEKK